MLTAGITEQEADGRSYVRRAIKELAELGPAETNGKAARTRSSAVSGNACPVDDGAHVPVVGVAVSPDGVAAIMLPRFPMVLTVSGHVPGSAFRAGGIGFLEVGGGQAGEESEPVFVGGAGLRVHMVREGAFGRPWAGPGAGRRAREDRRLRMTGSGASQSRSAPSCPLCTRGACGWHWPPAQHRQRCAGDVHRHLPTVTRPQLIWRPTWCRWSWPASASAPRWASSWKAVGGRLPYMTTIVAPAVATLPLLALCVLSGQAVSTIVLVGLRGLFGLGPTRCCPP
ncbi:hypothetical protein QFZ58_000196 [Streptomyces sp. B1I3]|nr:hypothetical protein [Streptomyces sp. B1I3]